MKNQYSFIACFLVLMSSVCADNYYDSYGQAELLERVMSIDVEADASRLRDASESFVTRFPQEESINEVRIKLLASYVGCKRYVTAKVYADRLLSNPLLKEVYKEDVEYYKVMIGVQHSKHWMAVLLNQKNVFRNEYDLKEVLVSLERFLVKYPNSGYRDGLLAIKVALRDVVAQHELGVALHYAKKGNFKAANARQERYLQQFSDIESPIMSELQAYPELL